MSKHHTHHLGKAKIEREQKFLTTIRKSKAGISYTIYAPYFSGKNPASGKNRAERRRDIWWDRTMPVRRRIARRLMALKNQKEAMKKALYARIERTHLRAIKRNAPKKYARA